MCTGERLGRVRSVEFCISLCTRLYTEGRLVSVDGVLFLSLCPPDVARRLWALSFRTPFQEMQPNFTYAYNPRHAPGGGGGGPGGGMYNAAGGGLGYRTGRHAGGRERRERRRRRKNKQGERHLFSEEGGGEGKKSFPPRWADKRSDSRRILSIQTPQRECPRDSTKGGRRVREEGGGAFSLLLFNLLAMLLTVVRCQRSTSLGSRKEGGEGGVSLYVSRVHALVRTYHRGQYGSSRIDADCLHVWTCLFVYVGVEVRVLRSVGAYYFCSCTRGGCIETGRLTDKEGSWFPRVRINLLTRFFFSSSRGR